VREAFGERLACIGYYEMVLVNKYGRPLVHKGLALENSLIDDACVYTVKSDIAQIHMAIKTFHYYV
jgi:hypothetical protein